MIKTSTALALLLTCSQAIAAGSIPDGYGKGATPSRPMDLYAAIVNQYNASGEEFRISGHCQSACTMFLGIRNVCIERSATLFFHAAPNTRGTSMMLSSYNGPLQSYLLAHNFAHDLALSPISGGDLINKFGYRECGKK